MHTGRHKKLDLKQAVIAYDVIYVNRKSSVSDVIQRTQGSEMVKTVCLSLQKQTWRQE